MDKKYNTFAGFPADELLGATTKMRKKIATWGLILTLMVPACVYHELIPPYNCDLSDLSMELTGITSAASCSVADGRIQVQATGGLEPYLYFIADNTSKLTGDFTNLAAGIYTVEVMDARGCRAQVENLVVQAAGFQFTANVTPDNQCFGDDGTMEVIVSEGIPPYEYNLDGMGFQSSNTFLDLKKGKHTVIVKDSDECSVTLQVTVPHGDTGTSWSGQILPIIENNCATDGCHNGIDRPDLRIYSKAKFYASFIKAFTQDRRMPPFEGTLSPVQIDLIACWVDDGAPEN